MSDFEQYNFYILIAMLHSKIILRITGVLDFVHHPEF
jgi:hypothetical protein